ncbi:MAG: ATP-binding protein [Planctomycetota bacterium]
MSLTFKKATKEDSRLRMCLTGPSGSGKTMTALKIATGLGGRVAVIDTERGSASKYADLFEFDVLELESFSPETYIEAIRAAQEQGYDVVVIDSLSHEWTGKGGALEINDQVAAKSKSKNRFNAWGEVTPRHRAMVDAITNSSCHVLATLRTKTQYVVETNERGKQEPRRVGLAPVQRQGIEYEFDVMALMDLDNTMVIEKTRCPDLIGAVIERPGQEVADILKRWLVGAPRSPSDELRLALREAGKSWSDIAKQAHEWIGRRTSKDEPLTEDEMRLICARLRKRGLEFQQRDTEPLPTSEQSLEEALEALHVVRTHLEWPPSDVSSFCRETMGKAIEDLSAKEVHQLIAAIEEEAKKG